MTMNSSGSPEHNRLKLIEEMLESQPDDAFLLYAAALEYHKSGNSSKAVLVLEKLRKEQPDYLATYYQLGKWYESSGETEKAIGTYSAGKEVARAAGDFKTLSELSEALNLLTDDDY